MVLLMLVLNMLIVSSGLGCGGIRLCIVERLVSNGMLILIRDMLLCWVMMNISGISRMKLILKNSGMFIRNVVSIID